MPEQDDFIGVLRDVPSYVNSNNVGQPYTSYVPFVLKLLPRHIKDYNMVRFFYYFVTLVHFQKSFDLTLSIMYY